MQLHSKHKNASGIHRVWLYSFVFAGKLSFAAVFVLLFSFMIQPFHQALANESAAAVEAENALPEEVAEQLPDPEPEPEIAEVNTLEPETITESEPEIKDTAQDQTDVVDESSEIQTEPEVMNATELDTADLHVPQSTTTETTIEDIVADESATTTEAEIEKESGTSTPDEVVLTDQISTSTASSSDTFADDDPELDETATTTEQNTDTDNPAVPDEEETSSEGGGSTSGDNDSQDDPGQSNDNSDAEDSPSDDLIDSGSIEAGVTDLVDDVVNEVVSITRQLVTEENYYQFSRQSCVAVGDGTFHCTMKDGIQVDPDSAVYAEQDAEGDMEIYMRTSKGEVKQLTDNQFDDTSPDLDLASMRVVWQRLVDGRYQIISYDLEEREETQLTFSRTNSMEPKVSKEGIVWQAWDGNDWEILFFDGKFTDQITDNNLQDVTPVVEDGYILWTVLGGTESQARVYSLETGEMMTISGYEGGAVENPRFVLVYDTKFENGDVVTQGFDPKTGLAKPISAQPTELPFDIPDADPVGEIRALIQNKSSNDKKDVVTVSTSTDSGDLNLASTTATSTVDTLVVTLDDVPADLSTVQPADDFELSEFDLVITPTASSAPAKMNIPLINTPAATNTEFISTSTQQ